MAILYHMRDGAPPKNFTRTQDVSLEFISEEFYGDKKRFLGPISEGLPPFNAEAGPADQNSEARYVVLKISESEAGSPEFAKPGYYLVVGAYPE
jgi:hypothetical protein